jgi:hypothetical protein
MVIGGDRLLRSFSAVYLKQQRIIALDCVNTMKDYVQGRQLAQDGSRQTAGASPTRRSGSGADECGMRKTAAPSPVLVPTRSVLTVMAVSTRPSLMTFP